MKCRPQPAPSRRRSQRETFRAARILADRGAGVLLVVLLALAISPIGCCCAMTQALERLAGGGGAAFLPPCCAANAPMCDGTTEPSRRHPHDRCSCQLLVLKGLTAGGATAALNAIALHPPRSFAPATALPATASVPLQVCGARMRWRTPPPGPPADPVSTHRKLVV